jgi:probable rRNA maturation factor
MTRQMILISTNHPYLRFASKDVIRTLRRVYQGEGKEIPRLGVIFTHNSFIKKMNGEFLKHNTITDVIAFSLGGDGGVESEIYINLDAARHQAQKYGVTFTSEVKRLLIHGALHLLGYRDETSKEKVLMDRQENFYVTMTS